jgi:hypothetical protein
VAGRGGSWDGECRMEAVRTVRRWKQCRDASGRCPGHGFEVQESTTVEAGREHSHGDSGLDFYVAVVGRQFRPCAVSAHEDGEEAGTGSWASRSAMSDDLCGV